MSTDVVKYAFIAGEISPTLFGRTDLTKFDLGMAEARNFFVDYRGGLSTRPGFEFIGHVKHDDKPTRFARFVFSPDEEDTYVVLFGDEYVRFLQGGGYVLEAERNITGVTKASPAVVTSAAHGLADGRWVRIDGVEGMTELNSKVYEVAAATANTFQLLTVPGGEPVDSSAFSAYTSGGTIRAIYEIESPYLAEELASLNFDQYRDQLRITCADFPVRNLKRTDHTNWTIELEEIASGEVGPSVSSSSSSDVGDAQVIFGVSSVFSDGSESAIGALRKVSGIVNYPVTEGSVSINWAADPDAESYNVYRSVISVSESLSFGSELGYAGKTTGTKFTDPNIIPDFGRSPPNNYNPFTPGAVLSIRVTSGGSGYAAGSSVTLTDATGSGFLGRAVVDDSGSIVSVKVVLPGEGYTNPTINFGGGGIGAAGTVEVRDLVGTYPALSAIYQQRQIYAASEINPITVWGSQYKRFNNFNFSESALDTDSFEFNLDTPAIAPIRHMLSTRGGLLLMTQENVWLLNGGSDGKALTPNQALADPQTYTGVSTLTPLRIGEDILYSEGKGYAVRMLGYNELSRVYSGDDKSILSAHLFGPNKEIVAWGYQESPYKTVWGVRSDGALLAFTVVKSEDVFAWTPCETQGRFKDLIVVQEGTEDRVYVTTERYVNGRWSKFIERQDLRQFKNVEDAWCVDCGLTLTGTTPAGTLTILRDEDDNYTATISGGNLIGTEGKVLRAGNGIFDVLSSTRTSASLRVRAEPDNWVPETNRAYTFPSPVGTWTLDTPVTTLSGLDHLEGEWVSILGDGNVFPRQQVVNGSITLGYAVTRAIVGLRFTARAKTLPLIVPNAGIEAKRKRIVAISARVTRTRGLRAGDSYETLYEFPERTDEPWGIPIALQDGIQQMPLGTTWDEEAHTYFLLDDPVPATLLSLVQDVEVGDDPD